MQRDFFWRIFVSEIPAVCKACRKTGYVRRVVSFGSLLLFRQRAVHLFVEVYAPRPRGPQLVVTSARCELTGLAYVDGALVVRGVEVLDRVGRGVGFEFG